MLQTLNYRNSVVHDINVEQHYASAKIHTLAIIFVEPVS